MLGPLHRRPNAPAAKDLFAVANEAGGYQHCYVSKQPSTALELDQMIEAIKCAELACIRYRGFDPILLKRLTDEGEARQCDQIRPQQNAQGPGTEDGPYPPADAHLADVLEIYR